MDLIAPEGPIYQAGTLSGNPLAMAAGIATLGIVKQPEFYKRLEEKSSWFGDELLALAASYSVPVVLNRVGSMMTCFFTAEPVWDFQTALRADSDRYGQYYRHMRTQGVWLAPSQFEALFISAAHEPEHLEKALAATESSFKKLMK